LKIIHIITGLDIGGAETSLLRLLSRLSPLYATHVISLSTIGTIGNEIAALGVPVESVGMRAGFPEPLSLIRLVRRLRVLKPDLVHTWMYHADLVGAIAARLARVPAVTWAIRNTDLSVDKTKRSTRAVVRTCALLSHRGPDKILSCSLTARDVHVALGYDEDRFVVIPNGFDLSQFCPDSAAFADVRHELGIPPHAPIIGLVGRLDPLKNHKGFLAAASILHARRPDVHFVLVGKGVEMSNPEIAAGIHEACLVGIIHPLGLRDDVPRLTAAFDVASSVSWGEAFPNAVGEAMACGVPCVVTDVGDSSYIVGDTGIVVAPGDAPAVAAAWEDLLSLSPEERWALGLRARARISENFALEAVVRRYEEFYEQLVRAKG
jgi:glycosyltransferase involved in cell wall biosynthesis